MRRRQLSFLPMASVFPDQYSLEIFFPLWTVSRSGSFTRQTLVLFPHDVGYTAWCALNTSAGSRSASIIFTCAFSDNVPEIVRTLYNCLMITNNKVRGLWESPPLHVLWLLRPETGGAVARCLFPVDCTRVAPYCCSCSCTTCCGRQAVSCADSNGADHWSPQ